MLRKLLDLILYTSVFTACCATGLCMATEQLVNGHLPFAFSPLHLLVFGSTLLVYNLHQAAKKRSVYATGLGTITIDARRWYIAFCILGGIMAGLGVAQLSWKMLTGCAVLGILSFAYSFPLLPFKNKKKLRDFGWLKITDLAGVWTIVTAVLPILYWDKSLAAYPVEILVRFTFIFTLCIIFDLRDVRADAANNIQTLPNKLGVKNSYRLINVTLLIFVLLSIVQYLRYPIWERLVGAVFTAIVTRLVVTYLKKYPSNRAYMLLADGVMLVYALTVLL